MEETGRGVEKSAFAGCNNKGETMQQKQKHTHIYEAFGEADCVQLLWTGYRSNSKN